MSRALSVFCITAKQNLQIETSCTLLKLMLCPKFTNLHLEMDNYQIYNHDVYIIMCLWAPMQIVNEKCVYSSLCTTVLLCISLTNSSDTSLIASEGTTTKNRDYTLETGCRCHLLTVNREGGLSKPTR